MLRLVMLGLRLRLALKLMLRLRLTLTAIFRLGSVLRLSIEHRFVLRLDLALCLG